MKWAAACVLFGLCALFVQKTSSVEDQAAGLQQELSFSAVHGGLDALKTGDWRSARYTGRRSLKGDHYVVVQQDDTPSPPPPSKVIIKKSSTPSPPPPSKVIIKKSSPCPSPPPPSSQVIKVVKSSSSTPSPPPPSKKVFGNLKFPFFP